jgi:hypothetical protein
VCPVAPVSSASGRLFLYTPSQLAAMCPKSIVQSSEEDLCPLTHWREYQKLSKEKLKNNGFQQTVVAKSPGND